MDINIKNFLESEMKWLKKTSKKGERYSNKFNQFLIKIWINSLEDQSKL